MADFDDGAYAASALGVLVVGFAGSGKSSLVQRIAAHFSAKARRRAEAEAEAEGTGGGEREAARGADGGGPSPSASPVTSGRPPYVLNLDPAVLECPYEANIDIRDTLSYKGVMQQYQLGPNGAIVTALNLYATRFHEVIGIIEQRRAEVSVLLMDTPGQIECFTWSASGAIIAESVANTMPSCVLFVVDGSRCASSPRTFMSNMLQACSILYKMNLPIVIAFNKCDVCDASFAKQWMGDFETFLAAMDEREKSCSASDLSRSLCFVLDEFYNGLGCVVVSALTGEGMDDLEAALVGARREYMRDFLPELKAKREARGAEERQRQQREIDRLRRDVEQMSCGNGGAE